MTRAWRCHCRRCRLERIADRARKLALVLCVMYLGGHVLVYLAR